MSAALNIICETGQWAKDFTEFTVTALEKMPEATKCSDHCTISLMVKGRRGKAVPLQAWSGPEGSRKLRVLDFMTTAQDGGKVVA
jgi:hypothetical protein